jgi:hybrid cluster-associated redox disulfide protein
MQKIKKDTMLGEIASKYPAAIPVLFENGLHCIGCHVSAFETIEQGARAHGLDDKQIDEMLKKMNSECEKDEKNSKKKK